jgi:hypothetical protein
VTTSDNTCVPCCTGRTSATSTASDASPTSACNQGTSILLMLFDASRLDISYSARVFRVFLAASNSALGFGATKIQHWSSLLRAIRLAGEELTLELQSASLVSILPGHRSYRFLLQHPPSQQPSTTTAHLHSTSQSPSSCAMAPSTN